MQQCEGKSDAACKTEGGTPGTSGLTQNPISALPSPRICVNQLRSEKPIARGLKRLAFQILAGIFFGLGALGAVLPGLPATPFLLLTSYFLLRSCPRLNEALVQSRLFGPILTDWQMHGGVRRDVKVQAIVVVVIAVGATIILSGYSIVPSLTVILLASVGIAVIVRLPTANAS